MPPVTLISGASKGIGLAIATAMHDAGFKVYGTSRNPENYNHLPFHILPLDVTDSASVEACVDTVLQREDHIDILVNNAGYDLFGSAEKTSMEELIAQMDANFYGLVRLTKAVLPAMKQRQHGKIINISSIGGLMSFPFNSAYAASKFAVEGYSESLRLELRPFNVHVALVEPAGVNTKTLHSSIQLVSGTDEAGKKMATTIRDFGHQAKLYPEHVAQTVVKIAKQTHPKLRYPVGFNARFLPFLRQTLPHKMYETVMTKLFL